MVTSSMSRTRDMNDVTMSRVRDKSTSRTFWHATFLCHLVKSTLTVFGQSTFTPQQQAPAVTRSPRNRAVIMSLLSSTCLDVASIAESSTSSTGDPSLPRRSAYGHNTFDNKLPVRTLLSADRELASPAAWVTLNFDRQEKTTTREVQPTLELRG
jgi:hypothetical protein